MCFPIFTSVITGTGFLPDKLPVLSVDIATSGDASQQGRIELDPTLQQPLYAVPSEAQRPRLVCQMILQDVVVMKLGNFLLGTPAVVDPNAPAVDPNAPAQAQAPNTQTLLH